MNDIKFQQRAIDLAKESIGLVSPRPAVGALIVQEDEIISEGKTLESPNDHAEAAAIKNAKVDLSNAILYCTLEPHNFTTHDIPCTELIINSGIKKISCPKKDINHKVDGKGFKRLEEAGIIVEKSWGSNQLEQIEKLYESYDFYIKNQKPRISAKFAMSLDGKISTSTNESKWITSEESRRKVHEIRNSCDAIITGINTVTSDNAKLTSRIDGIYSGKPKYRVVLDNNCKLDETHEIYSDINSGNVIWFTSKDINKKNLPNHITHIKSKYAYISPKEVIEYLEDLGCYEILVESGGTLLGSFFDQRLVNNIYAFISPVIFGGISAPSPVGGKGIEKIIDKIKLSNTTVERIKDDILITGIID